MIWKGEYMRGVEISGACLSFGKVGRGISIGRISMPAPERGFSVSRIANPFLGASKGPSILNPLDMNKFAPAALKTIRKPFASKRVQSFIPISEVKPLPRHPRVGGDPKSVSSQASLIKHNTHEFRSVGRSIKYGMTKGSERFLDRKTSGWTGNLVRTPEPAIVRLPNPFQVPKVEAIPQTLQRKTEIRPVSIVKRIVSPVTVSQVQAEQVVEEKVIKEQKNEPEIKTRKKQSVLKIKFKEAVGISKNRIATLKEAYQRVKAEGLSVRWLRKFLTKSYWEAISPIAQKGHDGTLNLTVSELEKQKEEYQDEAKADQSIAYAVANHIPVEAGEGGRPATWEEVREVLEGKEKEAIKSNTPAEMVVKRVVEKNVGVIKSGQVMVSSVEKEEIKETSLKELGLEEVFPKAA